MPHVLVADTLAGEDDNNNTLKYILKTMKTKYIGLAALALLSIPLAAQETYQDTKLVDKDLNGTARYVGMGGAMEALGADISTISTNPAGLGLFRSSQFAISGGMVAQQDATTSPAYGRLGIDIKGNKTNASFDQVGLVYSMRSGRYKYLNVAFNYHKSCNFDQILTAGGALRNASQNKLSAVKYPFADNYNWNGVDANYKSLMSPVLDDKGKQVGMDYLNGTAYLFGQYQKGYIGEYSFCLSGNVSNQLYLGVTFGLRDVNYRSNSFYRENLEHNAGVGTWEDLQIDGNGFDIKAGAIFRPVETSPFRIGAYIHTPTWYDLKLRGANDITMRQDKQSVDKGQQAEYDFKVYTPWKFGVSFGHTIGQQVALGATYEYADYGTMDNRVNDGGYYDYWDGRYYESTISDNGMNDHTKATLKGVSTIKLGAEYKPTVNVAIRLGYNYLSPMFDKNGFRDGSISSPGSAYATSTDYTNWGSTNRFTCGMGYAVKKFYVDLAYQYSQTDGTFYPFMSYYAEKSKESQSNIVDGVSVNNKRHQLLLTLGYKF